MANHTVDAGDIGVHEQTLTATTVDTVTYADDLREVEVLNVDGAAAIYLTTDGSAPTVGGEHCYFVPAIAGAARELRVHAPGATVVKLISAGTPKFSVSKPE